MVRKLKSNSNGGQQDIIAKAKAMQEQMLAVQETLKDIVVEHSVAGGAINIKVDAQKNLLDIDINLEILEDAVNEKDTKQLTSLLVPAIKEAMKKADKVAEEKMEAITGGINIPGLF